MKLRYIGLFFVWSCIFITTDSEITVRKTGWLDRVIGYFKQRFVADVQDKLPPIEFKAKIVKAPDGYVDSKKWDYDSVTRLLKLIRSSEKTKPLAKALRRALHPKTRRSFKGSKIQKSYKNFPKYPSKHVNVFYYDSYYDDYGAGSDDDDFGSCGNETIDDDDIITVSNPVEARLPSAHISVKMLRELLEARAAAARVMPPTRPSTIYWKPMNTTEKGKGSKDGDAGSNDTATDDGNGTTEAGGDGNVTEGAVKDAGGNGTESNDTTGNDTNDTNGTG
ncbi:hypothetical protein O0L34_g18005 [Tuta absoluta]|nr:hypothetical protein O0L34_g18005 [Tuta absoluta]